MILLDHRQLQSMAEEAHSHTGELESHYHKEEDVRY